MKRIVSLIFLFAACTLAFAQAGIKVQMPNVVAADEQFNVTFIIESDDAPSEFSWDPGSDFQLVWGPQKGHSTSTSIINGKRSKSSQYTYTYVLMPKKTGKFSIPEARAVIKGNALNSLRTSVEVVSGSSSSSSGGSQTQGSSSGSNQTSGEIARDDLFLKLSLSRSNVVVGEPITATLKLYQRVNIAGFEDAKFPTFNGFWSQETFAPTNIEFKRESYNDNIYNTAVLRSYVLIPQQAGDITIEPAELVCLVNVRAPSTGINSIFDSFFQDDYRTIRKRITSESCKVHVSKLPAGAPASFGGGVGKFDMMVSLSKDSLKTHDAASLFVTVSGKGNVSLLQAPKINFPPDFEVYDVKITENTDKSGGNISGSRTFEYPFIPRSHGHFEFGPVEYSFYDVSNSKYVSLSSGPVVVDVAKGNESASTQAGTQLQSGSLRKDVKSLGSDIRFIRTRKAGFSEKGSLFLGSGLFIALLVLIFVAAGVLCFVLDRILARRADVAGTKNRTATKMARKRLSLAQGYLNNNLYTAFYEELHKALLGFISDKLNMDSADMSKENVSVSLIKAGVSETLSESFTSLLDACEFARYAPDAGHEAMDAHYRSAVEVISSIDASMKGKKNNVSGAVTALVAIFMLLPLSASAAQEEYPESQWNAGVEAYAEGDWTSAREAWMSIEQLGLESVDLYYNIGNAFFKEGDYAHAILYYERALKLDPSDADSRFNLEFANSLIQDKIDSVPEFFLKTWTRKLCWLLSSGAWAGLFLFLLALTLAGALLFYLAKTSANKRLGFFGALLCLLFSLASLSFSIWQKNDYFSQDEAIVTAAVSSVKSSPASDTAKDLFILHEGTKVGVLDTVGSWNNIELSDGRQGWIRSSDLELI